jgi:hypothetical protein
MERTLLPKKDAELVAEEYRLAALVPPRYRWRVLSVPAGARFALRDAAKALDLVESRQSVGKVLLVP